MADSPAVTEACLNCGSPLTGLHCASCGQKKPHTDLTLREFVHETTQELTQWDGKVPATLKALFLKPGLLTIDFLQGRRARWLLPLRLYLICSVAFFVSKPVVEAITHRSVREAAKFSVTNPDGGATLTPEARKQLDAGLPARIFGRERMERAAANSGQLNSAIDSAFPKAMFVLLPLFALLTNVAWRRKLPRYPAHLYAALHLHAAWFGALAVATTATAFLPTSVAVFVGVALIAYIAWYTLVAFRRIFGDSWPRTIAKAGAIGAAYLASFFAVSLLMLGFALMTM